ncbi:MAG: PAS domain-containing protein [Bacteroidetes bacterium]|nr:PAS domain-containing protein [Bacteroidota bacterium]
MAKTPKPKPIDPYVVGIGASAGGLDAIQKLFARMPIDTGLSFVIIQHLAPDFESLMPDLLARHTKIPIVKAGDKQLIKPNTIYLNDGKKNLHIKGDRLFSMAKGPKGYLNLPIDIFFQTLGEEHGERSVGIILSGTGSDGSRGIKTIKEKGGLVLVQDPGEAQFNGMPGSAIATSITDFVLPIIKIAELISKFPNRTRISSLTDDKNLNEEAIFQKILSLVQGESGINFKLYKPNTLLRRLEKRMGLIGVSSLQAYKEYLDANHSERIALGQDFLIGVTSFFRDTPAFQLFNDWILPEIVQRKQEDEEVRIWIPGCSTGQEVYTMAILFDEYIHQTNTRVNYKIFATDVDGEAITTASKGVYHANIINEVEETYLDRYFVGEGADYRVVKRIRDRIVFSKHDIINDPPFIRLDLISCRNLLIYFDTQAQSKVLRNFQFSLNPKGILFLGSSESLGPVQGGFKVIDEKWRLFQKVGEPNPNLERSEYEFSNRKRSVEPAIALREPGMRKPTTGAADLFYRYLGKRFSPASLFVDENFNILFLVGNVGARLKHQEGVFQDNLLKMLSPRLAAQVRKGVEVLKGEPKTQEIRINDVLDPEEESAEFDLVFHRPIENQLKGAYLIHFSENRPFSNKVKVLEPVQSSDSQEERINYLQDRLRIAEEELQRTIEELETTNEELQSSNEELMASNEELQSTNEELQSVNEEIYTVNAELQDSNHRLKLINDDLANLLNSTNIATLFLDSELNIRNFTPELKRHFKLGDTDIGRPISSFASSFSEDDRLSIINDSKLVLKDLKETEREIVDENGKTFLKRIVPFITNDNIVEGLVINFIDVDQLKLKEESLRLKQAELLQSQKLAKIGSWILNVQTNDVDWTDELYKMYGLDPGLAPPGYDDHAKLFSPESWERLSAAVEQLVLKGTAYEMELNFVRVDGEKGWLFVKGEAEFDRDGQVIYARGIAQDITERKELMLRLEAERQFSSRISNISPAAIYIYDFEEQKNTFINPQYQGLLGYSKDEINAMSPEAFFSLFHPDDQEAVGKHMGIVLSDRTADRLEYRFKHKDGHWVWCYSIDAPFELNEEGGVKQMIGAFIDITKQKNYQEELKQAVKEADSANVLKTQFLANMSHEIRTPLNWMVGFADLLRNEDLDKQERNEYLDHINNASAQLLRLINDILDVAKIEAGELKISCKNVNVSDIVRSLERSFKETIKERNAPLKLLAQIPEKEDNLILETDAMRFQQILTNLLGNAIKFSEKGKIEFGYHCRVDLVEFYVKDQGIGIPPEKLERVFDRFEHLDTLEKRYDGTGLGLSICRGILNLLGGQMTVESEVGRGSTFKFTLPLEMGHKEELEKKEEQERNAEDLNGLRILIAEDSEASVQYLKALFRNYDLELNIAENGLEAVKLYKERPKIDVVLMDIQMPLMDGVEAMTQIKESHAKAKIVATTANAMSSDHQKYLDLGFDDYLAKPLRKKDLVNVILKLAEES